MTDNSNAWKAAGIAITLIGAVIGTAEAIRAHQDKKDDDRRKLDELLALGYDDAEYGVADDSTMDNSDSNGSDDASVNDEPVPHGCDEADYDVPESHDADNDTTDDGDDSDSYVPESDKPCRCNHHCHCCDDEDDEVTPVFANVYGSGLGSRLSYLYNRTKLGTGYSVRNAANRAYDEFKLKKDNKSGYEPKHASDNIRTSDNENVDDTKVGDDSGNLIGVSYRKLLSNDIQDKVDRVLNETNDKTSKSDDKVLNGIIEFHLPLDVPVDNNEAGTHAPVKPLFPDDSDASDSDTISEADEVKRNYHIRCFQCGRELSWMKDSFGREGRYDANVIGGLELTSSGEYGSTFWDEDGHGSMLSVVLCDDCLQKYSDRLHVRIGKGPWGKPITYSEYDDLENKRIEEANRRFDEAMRRKLSVLHRHHHDD